MPCKSYWRRHYNLPGCATAGFFLLSSESNQLSLQGSVLAESRSRSHFIAESYPNLPPDLEAFTEDGSGYQPAGCFRSSRDWLPEGCLTGICVSVQSDSGPFGTLWAFDRRARQVKDRDIHVLKSIGAQVSTILERAVLIEREPESDSPEKRTPGDLRIVSG